jgi:hypothetical protein
MENPNKIINEPEEKTEFVQLKEYKTPKLKKYGDISELVLGGMNAGTDGGDPFLSFS